MWHMTLDMWHVTHGIFFFFPFFFQSSVPVHFCSFLSVSVRFCLFRFFVSVLLSAHIERFSVSRIGNFFLIETHPHIWKNQQSIYNNKYSWWVNLSRFISILFQTYLLSCLEDFLVLVKRTNQLCLLSPLKSHLPPVFDFLFWRGLHHTILRLSGLRYAGIFK